MSTEINIPERIAGWHRAMPAGSYGGTNALAIDVEDYFHAEAMACAIPRTEWDARESHIERNVDNILALLQDAGATATFFTLGWIAQRYPGMIRRITAGGHELASHGMAHDRADGQAPDAFLRDAAQARALLEDTGGVAVAGYRAASFSITRKNLWAHEQLRHAGYRYSSSIYPIRHDLYGIADAPRFPFRPIPGDTFLEIPVSTVRWRGVNVPCGGGGYFRLLPYWLSARNIASLHRRDHRPCNFYFHPWEIDPGQPRIPGLSAKARFRHYLNLHRTEPRLRRLLNDFRWRRLDEVYGL